MNVKALLKGLLATAALLTLSVNAAPAADKTFEKKYAQVMGQEMAYIDEGKGRPVVFLHGNPTSSYLWRNIIPYIAKDYRAIAPDLIGMGDSAKPKLKYTYREQANYLHAFLDKLDLKDAVLVVHDWGSALGFHYARTRSERISAIAFMEATLPPFYPIPSLDAMGPSAEFLKNVRSPGIGEEMIMKQNILIDQFLRTSTAKAPLNEQIMAEYNRYYPTAESRRPVLQWLREIPINGEPAKVHNTGLKNNQWLVTTEIPKLLLYVTPGVLVNETTVNYMRANAKNLEVIPLGAGGHFVQEEYPDKIGRELAAWLSRT
ncbi:haloalkane dehalogenase [Thalassomonas actiniarum]|uniref:Haloalkane dehalogenase n=1 Tax=Thalassomonas actiniarum TaxID=485447 RepID=A0AAE9YRB9_9GAMM|nr:haloalkane dehalogenase [Thalassomonas actiniarum]WDD99814.1 haloalkane dehalogenase [Thalassomonas actiniarum]